VVFTNGALFGTAFDGGTNNDGTLYALNLSAPPVLLEVQVTGGSAMMTWANSAYNLQVAPAPAGPWSTLQDATSPYIVPATNTAAFFRLVNTKGN
jgi:uncharacterized repeat protein (TIGR03803 family)